MNAAHFHLVLNHLPIAGILFSFPLLFIACWKKNDILTLTGLTSIFITGLLTIPAYLTGEPTEEIIEHLPGVSEKLIKIHEEAAEKAIWVIGAAAVFSLIGLILNYRKKQIPKRLVQLVLLLSLCSIAILAWTNNLGGQIRHSEIRDAASGELPVSNEAEEKEDRD